MNPWTRLNSALTTVGGWGMFLVQASYWLLPRAVRARRCKVPGSEVLAQLDRLSYAIFPLIAVVLFFVGMILALQLATILKLLGVLEYVPDIVGVAMVREMAPLLTGVVLSGFAGASIAAEIGSMQVSEELMAMEALAMHPPRYLVAPRLIAAAIACPLVTVFGCYVGIGGGLAISELLLGLSPAMYIQRTLDALAMNDLILAMVKGEAFGLIVTSIACYEGAHVHGGARGVGQATTAAVVKSVVAIIAADLFLTVLFFNLP